MLYECLLVHQTIVCGSLHLPSHLDISGISVAEGIGFELSILLHGSWLPVVLIFASQKKKNGNIYYVIKQEVNYYFNEQGMHCTIFKRRTRREMILALFKLLNLQCCFNIVASFMFAFTNLLTAYGRD